MNNCKYCYHPLTYKPGGTQLTFIFKSGKIYKTHDKVKYPDRYTVKVIKSNMNTFDPVTFAISEKTLIYEKN
jgi:hypothetical protein